MQATSQKEFQGWISCENRRPTIEDCGQKNKKVAALPHHPDVNIEFVYYYNVHSNRHSHWHPINFQLPNQQVLADYKNLCVAKTS